MTLESIRLLPSIDGRLYLTNEMQVWWNHRLVDGNV